MIVRLIAAAAFALPALAGLRITLVERFDERILNTSVTLPTVEAGTVTEFKFRVRATGTSPVRLDGFTLNGADFITTSPPMPTVSLAPGAYVDLDVEFRPAVAGSSSAVLRANDQTVLVVAQATPAPFVRLENGAALRVGESVDFGKVELGAPAVRRFVIENPTVQAVTITRLKVVGTAFLSQLPPAPFDVAAGALQPFEVAFEPQTEGRHGATLYLNSREFAFEGSAAMPEVTKPHIVIEPAAVRSGQQAKVAVKLGAAARWPVEGVLRMEFSGQADPAVRFLSGDGKALAFRIAAGEDTARFGTFAAADFQAGTTAGRVTFAVELQSHREQVTVELAPAPVEFDSVAAVRATYSVELGFSGFDNTRTASALAFTFLDRSGRTIGRGAVKVDAAQDFRRYFDAATLGGIFSLRAVFPVRGNVAEIGSVDVEVVNSQGAARRSVTMSQ
ncbi:MAG TPA: choice-of-anchor D domain-containing protein [Bryobacteraceae bacterium]|nr:choice-of-anchor D domain-containing protein [Bryobacteraceae bacterium]